MPWLRALSLLTILLATSGYAFRCYWMCTDQTSIQQDYVKQRDQCRKLAQLKVDTDSVPPVNDNERKAKLESYFSDCMAQNGWAVPGGKDNIATGSIPPEEKASLSRTGECAFARANAGQSVIAAKRARACDLECAQALKAAPEAPRPAACPPAADDDLSEGADRR